MLKWSNSGFWRWLVQRYQCPTCKRTRSDIPKRPLDRLLVEPEKAYQVIRMLCEGIGIRAIERLTGLNRRTVLGILATAGRKCADLMDDKIRNLHVSQVQTDEIWCFVGCKSINAPAIDPERGDQYVYLTVDRDSKLIINHLIGRRTGENCEIVMRDLKTRIAGQFQLSTDAFRGYASRKGAVFQTFGHKH